MKEAARQGLLGLGSKPLDTEHIQGFLEDFGLDAEFGVHSPHPRLVRCAACSLPPKTVNPVDIDVHLLQLGPGTQHQPCGYLHSSFVGEFAGRA